ncbi:MAG: PhnA domain-containing protein [Saprospiraceae bacterium]
MSLTSELETRSDNKCELCSSVDNLSAYTVPPKSDDRIDNQVVICEPCKIQIEDPEKIDKNHWRCLNDSMWSQIPAVQVMAYRMLDNLSSEGWAQDALGMIYLDDKTMEWAKDGADDVKIIHKDSNGHILSSGDSVVLIKDLNVKGASFIAKRGTAVRRIRLVHDNAGHIEGKIDGQHIVILTEFVKKT